MSTQLELGDFVKYFQSIIIFVNVLLIHFLFGHKTVPEDSSLPFPHVTTCEYESTKTIFNSASVLIFSSKK